MLLLSEKNARPEMFKLDYEQILRTLNEQSNHEFVCLLRLHPNDSKRCNFMKYTESVKNASSYPDMQELLSAAHILITDYSGCMFDFAISKKPVFLYVADLEKYLLEERDLYFSFSELPFSYAKTVEELLNNIFVFDNKNYIRKCDEFFSKIGMNEDGLGAETIGNIIIEKCGL